MPLEVRLMCWAHVLIRNSGICDSKLTEFEGRSPRIKFAANCVCNLHNNQVGMDTSHLIVEINTQS